MFAALIKSVSYQLYRGYYMAARGCEFYLRVLKVSFRVGRGRSEEEEEEARVLLANRVRYHDDTYILTCER